VLVSPRSVRVEVPTDAVDLVVLVVNTVARVEGGRLRPRYDDPNSGATGRRGGRPQVDDGSDNGTAPMSAARSLR